MQSIPEDANLTSAQSGLDRLLGKFWEATEKLSLGPIKFPATFCISAIGTGKLAFTRQTPTQLHAHAKQPFSAKGMNYSIHKTPPSGSQYTLFLDISTFGAMSFLALRQSPKSTSTTAFTPRNAKCTIDPGRHSLLPVAITPKGVFKGVSTPNGAVSLGDSFEYVLRCEQMLHTARPGHYGGRPQGPPRNCGKVLGYELRCCLARRVRCRCDSQVWQPAVNTGT